MKYKPSRGFGLIELMIAIAIIAILAAVAIPSYRSYIHRAKISDLFHNFDAIRAAAVAYYTVNLTMPPNSVLFANPTIAALFQAANIGGTDHKWIVTELSEKDSKGVCATGTAGTRRCQIITLLRIEGEDVKFYCGTWQEPEAGFRVPKRLLPADCRSTNMGACASSGDCSGLL